ncbi:hypothetical protein AA3266_2877 [Gluconobacter kondonii NBRC 3266]|nr:hypothetical protein AA3266_2877 [Gluconobacter kondonii NBRC 3266]
MGLPLVEPKRCLCRFHQSKPVSTLKVLRWEAQSFQDSRQVPGINGLPIDLRLGPDSVETGAIEKGLLQGMILEPLIETTDGYRCRGQVDRYVRDLKRRTGRQQHHGIVGAGSWSISALTSKGLKVAFSVSRDRLGKRAKTGMKSC